MVLWNGACIVHEIFSLEKITRLKIRHPKAKVIAHPECEEPVLRVADYIGAVMGSVEDGIRKGGFKACPGIVQALNNHDFRLPGNPNHADAIVANQNLNDPNGGSVSVLLNDGTNNFPTRIDYPAGAYPTDVVLGNFRGDNRVDIVVSNAGLTRPGRAVEATTADFQEHFAVNVLAAGDTMLCSSRSISP